jgi:hypothetical protein
VGNKYYISVVKNPFQRKGFFLFMFSAVDMAFRVMVLGIITIFMTRLYTFIFHFMVVKNVFRDHAASRLILLCVLCINHNGGIAGSAAYGSNALY